MRFDELRAPHQNRRCDKLDIDVCGNSALYNVAARCYAHVSGAEEERHSEQVGEDVQGLGQSTRVTLEETFRFLRPCADFKCYNLRK